MIASSVNVIHAVWLDPFSPLDAADRAQLSAAGISLETVSTLGDLTLALRRAHVLVIRLGDSAELLQEVQTLVAQLGHTVPVLCRVDRRRMEVAVDAMRLGALHVLPADEWSSNAWQDAVKGLNAPELKTKSYVFVDPTSQHLLALAQRVAQANVTALIEGPTGAGKTRLLHCLREQGAQVLDLEGLANHRSSVLGIMPGLAQPSQKHFDTLLWHELRQFDPSKPVYIESESRKVGNLAVPESLIVAMRASPCYQLKLSDDERVLLLMEDYEFFVKDPTLFSSRLNALVAIRGKEVVEEWQRLIALGDIEKVVRELLTTHYDPTYFASMKRNFHQIDQAIVMMAKDRTHLSMTVLAKELAQT